MNYFIMEGRCIGDYCIVLYSLADPGRFDGWMLGSRFLDPIAEPVKAVIVEDNSEGVLLPFYSTPQIMTTRLYETLRNAGVDNLDVYDAIVEKEDGTVVSRDYKAFNVLGALKVANAAGTTFAASNPSTMVDASIRSLDIDEKRAHGLLMFRLAEYVGALVVHRKIKEAVEAAGIQHVIFTEPHGYLS